MFAALCEQEPIVKKYLGKFIALAPVVFVHYQESELLSKMADPQMLNFLEKIHVFNLLAPNWLSKTISV